MLKSVVAIVGLIVGGSAFAATNSGPCAQTALDRATAIRRHVETGSMEQRVDHVTGDVSKPGLITYDVSVGNDQDGWASYQIDVQQSFDSDGTAYCEVGGIR
jgi:hypothetical protein